MTLPWHLGSAYDTVYISAECLNKTGDLVAGRCLMEWSGDLVAVRCLTWSGVRRDRLTASYMR